MTRSSLSLFATLCLLLLFGAAPASQAAPTVGANCVIGSGSSAALVRANGWMNGATPSGYIYYGLGNGLNLSGNLSGLSITKLANGNLQGTASAYGYLMSGGARVAIVLLTATLVYNPTTGKGTIDLHSVGVYGSVYLWDSGVLPITSGTMLVTQ
jgi:hypothetical protein